MPIDELHPYYPPLTPITSPWMHEVVKDHSLLSDLFEQYGCSPINLHHLQPFADNYKAYETVLEKHDLQHTIFFARKANRCKDFAREAARLGFGVDTASYRELKQCLDLGCNADKLICTAAVKTERLVQLALNNDVLMVLDNADECRLVNRLASQLGKKPKVGIRISGFNYKGDKLYSRFGFDIADVVSFIRQCLGVEKEFNKLRFDGFHFHLDGYSVKQRGAALLQTIELTDQLQQLDISTSFIDIGGGFLTNYLSDKAEWESFWDVLKKAIQGKRAPLTFRNNGLGYKMINGQLHGSPDVYPYYNETPKEQFLDNVLSFQHKNGETAACLLHKRDIEIRMEPGRSLLAQTGMTIARVAHRKRDARGNWLVGLEMNRSQLSSSSADFLLDPLFIPLQSSGTKKELTPVYFTGAFCLEQDIILKRKIVLPHLPEIGDVTAFPNTAGYMMHFYETESHLLEKTTNLVTHSKLPFSFIPDEN